MTSYPGTVAEEAKEPMIPGVGIAPTYTISRVVLSDAVCLVRGDRYYTTDYNPRNLTNWGYNEVQYDLNVNQGCVFYKLFIRACELRRDHDSLKVADPNSSKFPITSSRTPSTHTILWLSLRRTRRSSLT